MRPYPQQRPDTTPTTHAERAQGYAVGNPGGGLAMLVVGGVLTYLVLVSLGHAKSITAKT